MVFLHDVVHVVVDIGTEGVTALAGMEMIEHLCGVAVHGAGVAQAGSLIGLDIDGNQIVERAVAALCIDEVVIIGERHAVHHGLLVVVVAHRLEGFYLGEHAESVEGVLFFGGVAVDVNLRHVHGEYELRIAVTHNLAVQLIHMVQNIVENAGARTSQGGADNPIEDGAVFTAYGLNVVEGGDGRLELRLEIRQRMGEGDTGFHTESTGAESQGLIGNLDGEFLGAGFEDSLVDERLGILLGLIVNGLGIGASKADQVRLGRDEGNLSVFERFAVPLVRLLDVARVGVYEQETIVVVHGLQARLRGGCRGETLFIDLFLDLGYGLAA